MRHLQLCLTLAGLLFSTIGCGKQDQPNSSPASTTQPATAAPSTCKRSGAKATGLLKIAVIPKGSTHEFWKSIHAGAVKAELELKEVQVEWKGPLRESDRAEQISIVENFINAGVSGIALAPMDDTALVRPIRDAAAAGISVVVMDSGVQADVCRDYASFVATDNYAGGGKAAQRIGEVLGGRGKVIMLRYDAGSASTMQREQGFLDTIKSRFPRIEIVSSDQRGGDTTESALAKAENLLNRFKDIDGIFTPNETTTFGMLLAVQQAGLGGKLKFVGFDTSEKLVQALADNRIQGLVVQNPMRIGYEAVRNLAAYLRGEAVPSRVDTGSVVATPENMHDPRIRELLSPPVREYLDQ